MPIAWNNEAVRANGKSVMTRNAPGIIPKWMYGPESSGPIIKRIRYKSIGIVRNIVNPMPF